MTPASTKTGPAGDTSTRPYPVSRRPGSIPRTRKSLLGPDHRCSPVPRVEGRPEVVFAAARSRSSCAGFPGPTPLVHVADDSVPLDLVAKRLAAHYLLPPALLT